MHASIATFAFISTDKNRCLPIFEVTFAIAIQSQEAEMEGIKTRVRKRLNQDCPMSHMGSTLIPNDQSMGLDRVSQAAREAQPRPGPALS